MDEEATSSGDEYIPESSPVDEEAVHDGSSGQKATPATRARRTPKGNKSAQGSSSRSGSKGHKARPVTPKQACTTPVSMH